MIVYMATNKINNKMYIGQTVFDLEKRKRDHISDALSKRNIYYFGKAIRKYGPENFEWKILDEARNIDELNDLEIFFIKLFDTFKNGYNLTKGGGGNLGYSLPNNVKQKISNSLKGKYVGKASPNYGKRGKNSPSYGRKHSEESKRKMSEIKKGITFSEEARKNMSKAQKGKIVSDETRKKLSEMRKGVGNSFFGKKHTKETREKMAKNHADFKGKNHPQAQAVIINNKQFDTLTDASVSLDVSLSTIHRRLKNKIPGYEYACKKEN